MKELKLHRERSSTFYSENIHGCTERYRKHALGAEMRFIIAHNWSHLLFFLVVGAILFYLPSLHHVSPQAMTGYVVATLYLMGPLSGVLGSLSVFGRASAALQKIENLGVTLAARATEQPVMERAVAAGRFDKIELVDITHTYFREKED